MRVYVALEIGCLECGNASRCLGVFTTREAAEATKALVDQNKPCFGSYAFAVFEAELTRREAA